MEKYLNEFQLGVVKFGPADVQDLGNHFLIIFSISLILYFAIFVDERSQPIINKADRGQAEETFSSIPPAETQVSIAASQLQPVSPETPKEYSSPQSSLISNIF